MCFATRFSHRGGDAVVELHPDDELGGGVTGDPDRCRRDEYFAIRPAQVPVFGAVIVANMIVVRPVKDPTRPRFIWRAVPIQLSGLATLLLGNLLLPHVWLWSVLGTSLYAFGIGMIFPTLFRFTLFSNNLPKGRFQPR